MIELRLPEVEGYEPTSQHTLAFMAAQLDDQLRRLRSSVEGLEVDALEWQLAPGRNTIGMLLAHIAVAETWWMQVGAKGLHRREQADAIVKGVIGIAPDDDGMPIPPDGTHPRLLRGTNVQDYLAMIDRARVATHVVLRGWTDDDLLASVGIRDRAVTKGWIVYHALEHMVAHYGQILLLAGLAKGEPAG